MNCIASLVGTTWENVQVSFGLPLCYIVLTFYVHVHMYALLECFGLFIHVSPTCLTRHLPPHGSRTISPSNVFGPLEDAKSVYASRKPHAQVHMHMHTSRRIRGLSIVHTRGGYIISQAVL